MRISSIGTTHEKKKSGGARVTKTVEERNSTDEEAVSKKGPRKKNKCLSVVTREMGFMNQKTSKDLSPEGKSLLVSGTPQIFGEKNWERKIMIHTRQPRKIGNKGRRSRARSSGN